MWCFAGLFFAAAETPARITVRANQPAHRVAPTLWGIFFEDINLSADGSTWGAALDTGIPAGKTSHGVAALAHDCTATHAGLYRGAGDFGNRNTAEVLLGGSPYLKWVAGYENWTPWLEGMLCDLMFFRMLLSGRFVRPGSRARWDPYGRPEDVAREVYGLFPTAVDLRFSLFYRSRERVCSTLEEHMGGRGE